MHFFAAKIKIYDDENQRFHSFNSTSNEFRSFSLVDWTLANIRKKRAQQKRFLPEYLKFTKIFAM